jgi:hypothetical protein
MKPRQTPRLPRSSRNWPPVTIELRGSPRLALAWALWCLGLGASLWAGCSLPGWACSGLDLLLAALAWRGAALLLGRGAQGGPQRLRWESDGRWWHERDPDPGVYVELDPPRRLGRLVWLRWAGPQGPGWWCLDGATMEPNAWARLQARMRLQVPATGDAPR